ncbi:MAG: hypothetical protein ACM3PY_18475, partial [Omnitrophica WOR_2 bacterium]
MATMQDGPHSSKFKPLVFRGNISLSTPPGDQASEMASFLSKEILADWAFAPGGSCVAWGIPFEIEECVMIANQPVSVEVSPIKARWLVFMHASDLRPQEPGKGGIISPSRGYGQLGEHAADYVIRYSDGSEVREVIRQRHQIGFYGRRIWGENCFQAVAQHKPYPLRAGDDQLQPFWGWSQTRTTSADEGVWVNWLWAWENPNPEKEISGLRFEPVCGAVIVSAISAGDVDSLPLRWQTRRKACLALPEGETFQPEVDNQGLLKQVQLDLGQVISATPRLVYPNEKWAHTYSNQLPELSKKELIIEYTAHPQACFHLFSPSGEQVIPVSEVEDAGHGVSFLPVRNAAQRVRLRVVERGSSRPVPVKLHIHGEWGEYLAPEDRHRILNPYWFEDYSADNVHIEDWLGRERSHASTYINGETFVRLPPGKVYIEVSKGFEIQPVRKVFDVTEDTDEIVIELERVLPWRQKGWVTADTHVHFLSPVTAMLEGSAEGVNIINLLASQWGELMTNVGDF